MDLETLIIVVFCVVDDFVRDLCRERRLRQRGPAPVLADSEVLTVEIVGEFLGLDTDQGLHAYFRRHFGHLFPGLRQVHRTTFLRQAANLWAVKHALWRRLLAVTGHDPAVTLVDSMPVPVCRFARAHRCRGFRGFAAFGYDALAHQTYYGLRLHLLVAWPGVITAATLAPANEADLAVAPQLRWVLSRSANPQPLQGFALRRRLWPGPTVTSSWTTAAPSSASSRPAPRSARSPPGSAATRPPSTASWGATASAMGIAASAATSP